MPQKSKKKSKSAKPKKPAKASKKPAGKSLLKKAAKTVAKKVNAALSKKTASAKKPAKAKSAKPTKPVKPAKASKAVAKKSALKPIKAKAALKPTAKGKQAPAAKGKRSAEVVIEVAAPKGVALLSREGKKKSKAAAEAAAAKKRCRETGCENEFSLHGYCRLHYIKNWRKIKRKEAIIASGQLNNYVEELVSKYPDKYLEVIRQDLASEKDWAKVVADLELDSSDDDSGNDEDMEGVSDVRPAREFEDDSDSF